MGKAIDIDGTGKPLTLHHEPTISDEEIHPLITFVVSITDSNIVDGL